MGMVAGLIENNAQSFSGPSNMTVAL